MRTLLDIKSKSLGADIQARRIVLDGVQAAIVLLNQLARFQESLMGWPERSESVRASILILSRVT